MNEEQEKIRSIENETIPLCIDKVVRGDWDARTASQFFNEQLKNIRPREKRRLTDLFNNKLRAVKRIGPSPDSQRFPSSNEPTVVIDGPNSVSPNQMATLTAKTLGYPRTEIYEWNAQGNVPGVDIPKNITGASYIIKAKEECGRGSIQVTAIGNESGAVGSYTIEVISSKKSQNRREQESKKPADSETEDNLPDQEQAKKSGLRDRLTQAARKRLLDPIKKRLTKQALAALWKALLPYLPWIILGIMVTVIAIAIYANFFKKAQSGEAGSTPHEQLDLAKDTDIMEKVILSTGDEEAKRALINNTFPSVQEDLLSLKNSADTETQAKIGSTSDKIDQYMANDDTELGKEIVSDLKEILSAVSQQAPTINTKTRPPLEKILDYNFDLHYGTPLNKELPKDDEGHGTYMFYGEGKADAVDLYADAGSQIFPVFSGKIVDISDDGTGHKRLVIQSGDYEILYSNFDLASGISNGQNVETNKSIGRIVDIDGEAQLHLEMSYQGKPIVTTELDKINYREGDKPWGEYLWIHFEKILGLE